MSRTGYQFQGKFQNRVSILREIFFRTGCQFKVPGGKYPPKKYPSAPPPPRVCPCHSISKKFSLPVLLCQKNGQNFGRNVNGLLILFEKMSSHFVLIIPLVSNRLIWQKRKHPRCTTCTFKHHHSSAKMHMTVLRDEQHQHCCAIVAVLKIFHALRKHCSSLQKRCDRDKIRLKLIKD